MIPTNKILNGDAMKHLKELPDECIDCIMTSPPYWALRDYGEDVESVWGVDEDCEHEWTSGFPAGDKRITKRSESRAGWERPSREEFSKRDVKNVCPICDKEFLGKPNQKFCSTKCLNTLSNDERTSMQQKSNFCNKCSAWKGQLGLEPTFDLYIKHLCDIFEEAKRTLKPTGTCWVNLGDTYSATRWTGEGKGQPMNKMKDGHRDINPQKVTPFPDKTLVMIPFRFAIEMVNRGWILRNVIIWHKPNCMPSSAKDRFTVDFEYVFFFTKNKKYFFERQFEPHLSVQNGSGKTNKNRRGLIKGDVQIGQEQRHSGNINYGKQGRNKRAVWKISPKPFPEAHFAVYPEELCETPIKSGCPLYVCEKCGKPKELDFEVQYINKDGEMKGVQTKQNVKRGKVEDVKGQSYGTGMGKDGPWGYTERLDKREKIKGYKPTCSCNAPFTSGIVLDMFMGAGTTALVALKQGKKFIGIELNPEYIKIAEKRLKPLLSQEKLI